MIDDDLLDFVLLLAPRHPAGCAVWTLLIIVPVLVWVLWSANECGRLCPGEGRVLEDQCYCVDPDGALRALQEYP